MRVTLYVATGFVCLLIALVFGLFGRVRVGSIANMSDDAWAPNVTNAGASCGFAIAGGLCFVAASLAGAIGSRSASDRKLD